MGYCVTMEISNLVIRKEVIDEALKAINDLFKPATLKKQASGGSYSGGKQTHWSYSWVTYPEGGFKALEEALQGWRYASHINDNGDLEIDMFEGEKLGDDQYLWKALAKYLTDGAIYCRGEDGALWCWEIKHGKFKELDGTVTYR
jgi:hypothetical protein